MTITVSRGSSHDSQGRKLCCFCHRRPRRPGQRSCGPCHTDYMREWRKGTIQMQLTPQERAAVLAARKAGWPVGGGLEAS